MLFKIVKALLVTLLFMLFLAFFIGKKLDVTQKPSDADIIICLGGGYVERLDKAIALYHKHYANKIIYTGALMHSRNSADKIGFWKIKYFVKHGVKKEDITYLKNMKNTHMEIKALKELMLRDGYKKALIVSDPTHSHRIHYFINLFEYKENGLNVKLIGSDVKWWSESEYCDSLQSFMYAFVEMISFVYNYLHYSILK